MKLDLSIQTHAKQQKTADSTHSFGALFDSQVLHLYCKLQRSLYTVLTSQNKLIDSLSLMIDESISKDTTKKYEKYLLTSMKQIKLERKSKSFTPICNCGLETKTEKDPRQKMKRFSTVPSLQLEPKHVSALFLKHSSLENKIDY